MNVLDLKMATDYDVYKPSDIVMLNLSMGFPLNANGEEYYAAITVSKRDAPSHLFESVYL